MRLHFAMICGALGFLSVPVAAQTARIPTGPTEAAIVTAAEAEGATYPRLPAPSKAPAGFSAQRDPLLGTSLAVLSRGPVTDARMTTTGRKCVRGTNLGPVRSGEFVIGGQLGGGEPLYSGRSALNSGRSAKIWWAPLHHSRDMAPLVVRGRNLNAPHDSVVFTLSRIAYSPPTKPTRASHEYFFPSGTTLPSLGQWLLIATSGPNWGCFRLTVS